MVKRIVFLISIYLPNVSLADYSWNVTRVIDGDTFEVDAKFYPKELGNITIRVSGVDTPEKAPRAKCEIENALAQKATAFTKTLIEGRRVIISNVKQDKYGGRVVASVTLGKSNLANALIANGLARPYDGGTKQSWCPSPK